MKCSEDIVAKAIMGNNEYTKYTILQYLERWVPDIPVPRPHGLITFAPFRVVFMHDSDQGLAQSCTRRQAVHTTPARRHISSTKDNETR